MNLEIYLIFISDRCSGLKPFLRILPAYLLNILKFSIAYFIRWGNIQIKVLKVHSP